MIYIGDLLKIKIVTGEYFIDTCLSIFTVFGKLDSGELFTPHFSIEHHKKMENQ